MNLTLHLKEQTVTISVTHYEPILEGRTSGPPEFCYPEEGGFAEWELLNGDEDLIDEDEIQEAIVVKMEKYLYDTLFDSYDD